MPKYAPTFHTIHYLSNLSLLQVVPPLTSLNGFVIRSCMVDTINIFEVNRRECARLVLELARWFAWGTFKAKRGMGAEPDDILDLDYILENTLLEVSERASERM